MNEFTVTTNQKSLWSLLTLLTITSICVFFILFFIHSLRWWHGEFVYQSRASLVGDNLLYPRILVTSVIQKWSRGKNLDASHSKGPKREKKPRVSCVNRKIGVFKALLNSANCPTRSLKSLSSRSTDLVTSCRLPLHHSKLEKLLQRYNWTEEFQMRCTRQHTLSILAPCISGYMK